MNQKTSPQGKKGQVKAMFNSIAHRYDFLNHFLSLGIDRSWRKKLVRESLQYKPEKILDVATGTADLAIELASLKPESIVGVDISDKMLQLGQLKINKLKLANLISLIEADSESLPFADKSFDFATVAFGVRNFEDLNKGLLEINRVLKPNGILAVLEFSMPEKFPFKQTYLFYFKIILPILGRLFSGDKGAYTYLPESVEGFPYGKAFETKLLEARFDHNKSFLLTGGIATIYFAQKPHKSL